MRTLKNLLTALSGVIFLVSCDALKDLNDPNYKYAEPYFGKWNVVSIKAYEMYLHGGNPENKVISNEREYTEAGGWIEFTKDEDADDLYYRGSFTVTYGTVDYLGNEYAAQTYEGAFKWSPDEAKSVYVEMDDNSRKVLGAGYSVQVLSRVLLKSPDMTLSINAGGYNNEYNVVEFNFRK